MGGDELMCTAEPVGGDGLINPAEFPCRAHDLDTSKITAAATGMRTMGTTVDTETSDIKTTWGGLTTHYKAPEQESVYALMDPAATSAGELKTALHSAAGHLDTYASELAGLKTTLREFESEAWSFRNEVKDGVYVDASEAKDAGFGDHVDGLVSMLPGVGDERQVLVPWYEDGDTVDRNKGLLEEYAGILEQVSTAATTCANAINALVTGKCIEVLEAIPAEAFTNPEQPMPWGYPRDEDRNCPESVGHGVSNFGYGMYSGAASLIGYDTEEGRWGWDVAGQSWGGLGNFLGSTIVLVTFTPHLAQLGVPMPDGAREWLIERGDVAAAGWSSLVGYDYYEMLEGGDGWHKWKEDGWAAGTESVLNVGTFFIPGAGQVGAAFKTGSTGARIARIVAAGTDFLVPGGSFAVRGGVNFVSHLRSAIRLGDDVPTGAGLNGVRFNPAALLDDVTDLPTPPVDRTPVSGDLFGGDGPMPRPDVLPDAPAATTGNVPDLPGGSRLPEQPSGVVPEQPGAGQVPEQPGRGTSEQPGGSQVPEQPGRGTSEQPGAGQVPEQPGRGTSEQPGGSQVPEQPGAGQVPEQPGAGQVPEQHGAGQVPEQPAGTAPEQQPGSHSAPESPQSRPSNGTHPSESRPRTPYDPDVEAPETISAKQAKQDHGRTYTPDDVQQALDEAPVNSHGDPVDPRTGNPLLLERSDGARGWEMRWDAENERWVAQNLGNGEAGGLPPRGTPDSFAYDADGVRMPYANNRPGYAPDQVDDVWDAALDQNGEVWVPGPEGQRVQIEWTPSTSRDGIWDMGHRPDHKYSDLRHAYLNHDLELPDFLKAFREPSHYQVEHPTVNRSHMNEDGSMDLAGPDDGGVPIDADGPQPRRDVDPGNGGEHGMPADASGSGSGLPGADPQHPLAHLASEVAPGDPRQALHAGSADRATLDAAFRSEYPTLLEVNVDRFNANRPGHGVNCTRCVIAADHALSGAPSSAMPVLGPGTLSDVYNTLGGTPRPVQSYGQIVDIMSALPEGTRGVVAINRGPGTVGHVFTVIHDRNGVVFLDSQTGRFATLEPNVARIDLIVVPNSASTTMTPPYAMPASTPAPPAVPPAPSAGGMRPPVPRIPVLAEAASHGVGPSTEEPR